MLGELTAEEIEKVIHSQVLGRIAYRAQNRIQIVPVGYAYDGRRILCHSPLGQKIHMMRQHPEVCFEVEDVKNLANWRSVVAAGRYEELQGSEAAVAMGLLVDRLLPLVASVGAPTHGVRSVTPHGQHEVGGADTVVYCIHLTEKTGRFEGP